MAKITALLHTAQQRAQQLNLPYQGALLPSEAFEILQSAPGATLVDVRSRAELDWVGRIPNAVEIEWATYPGMKANPDFAAALQQQVDKEAIVLFMCRTAQRSHAAAALAINLGYTNCYNILEGFEGDKNAVGQRRGTNGWCAAHLPWQQG